MKHVISLFLLLFLLPGCNARPLSAAPQHRYNHMQTGINYQQKLQQAARDCCDMRLVLRRFGREPVIIPLSQENKEGIRTLISRMQPTENDMRMRPRSSYSVNLQFLDAAGKPVFEYDTAAVNNGKGRAYGYLALPDEELTLWYQYIRRDDIIELIRKP